MTRTYKCGNPGDYTRHRSFKVTNTEAVSLENSKRIRIGRHALFCHSIGRLYSEEGLIATRDIIAAKMGNNKITIIHIGIADAGECFRTFLIAKTKRII